MIGLVIRIRVMLLRWYKDKARVKIIVNKIKEQVFYKNKREGELIEYNTMLRTDAEKLDVNRRQ